MDFLGWGRRTVITRKCATFQRRQTSTGDPDCPEGLKLTNWIEHLIGNKAVLGDVEEEEFNLEEGGFGKSGAGPSQDPEPSDGPEEGGVTASAPATSSSTAERRACQTPAEEREAKKNTFIAMNWLILLCTDLLSCS